LPFDFAWLLIRTATISGRSRNDPSCCENDPHIQVEHIVHANSVNEWLSQRYTNKHKHVCSGKSDSWRIVFSYFQSGRFPDGSSDSTKQIIGNKRKNYILTKEDFRVQ